MDLDSALLRAFVVLTEERHFGRAAERMLISQQALSKRIARLESLLGAKLVDRDQRRVTLTAAGERFLEPARLVVDDVDAAVATVRVRQRPLRVDVLDEHLWPVQLVRTAAERGAVPIDVVVRQQGRDALDVLRSGDADVVFGRAGAVPPPWPADLHRRLVLLEPLAAMVGPDDVWADREHVPLAELRTRPTWFPMTGSPPEWTGFLDQLADEHGLQIDYGGSTMGFGYWVERVTRGGAPPTFIGMAMELPPVQGARVVPIVDPSPFFPWSAMWRRRLPGALVEELLADVEDEPELRLGAGTAWLPERDHAYLRAGSTLRRRTSG